MPNVKIGVGIKISDLQDNRLNCLRSVLFNGDRPFRCFTYAYPVSSQPVLGNKLVPPDDKTVNILGYARADKI